MRIMVHVLNAVNGEAKPVFMRTVDTDVVAILLGQHFHLQSAESPINIWVGF